MKDINLVLLNKRVQLAELSVEIEGLQAAATALRPVVHLLADDEPTPANISARLAVSEEAHATALDGARAIQPERSRVRRWV